MKALHIKIGVRPRAALDFIGFCVPLPKNAVDLITKIVRKITLKSQVQVELFALR